MSMNAIPTPMSNLNAQNSHGPLVKVWASPDAMMIPVPIDKH